MPKPSSSSRRPDLSLGNRVTEQLSRIENFIENASVYLFPVKVLGWLVLFVALMVTNFIAILRWPVSALSKRLSKKEMAAGEPINITSDEALKKIISEQATVLVDFWAEWCGPCLLMDKSIKEIAKEYSGKVTVVKVDVSLNSALSKLYAVRGLPTFIVFEDGDEVLRKSGSLTKNQLKELTDPLARLN